MTKKTFALSAGGTGGHLFPAEALAEELLARGHKVAILTDKRGHAFRTLDGRADIYIVRAATLKPGLITKLRAVIDMTLGVFSAFSLLGRIRPAAVIGFGGYPSFPGVMAAQLRRIPTVLHEQNAVLGKANAALACGAKQIALSLPDTRGMKARHKIKSSVTGNPVRQGIIDLRARPYPAATGDIVILITGGSQAASIFGDVVPEALGVLPEKTRKRLFVMHQCREAELQAVQARYDAGGIRAETKAFFTDMPERLSACHLFIGRSGASTVAEVAVAGRPAVFVPYPAHKDMQQKYNAEIVANAGGGWIMLQDEFTPAKLGAHLASLFENTDQLQGFAESSRRSGRPEAVKSLADLVEKGHKNA